MKKLTTAAAILLALTASSSVLATDGTITFKGKVVDQSCVVHTDSKAATVTLPSVAKSSLKNQGDTTGMVPFTITLSSCDDSKGNSAKVYFDQSANVNLTTGRLKNAKESGAGGAQNVEVEILDTNSTDKINLALDSTGQGTNFTSVSGDTKLRYFAKYFATGEATAGEFETMLNYTIAYQ